MASFVSVLGKWYPRRERAVIQNAEPGKEIYDGLDRDALDMMREGGLLDENGNPKEYFGDSIYTNMDLLTVARQKGFKDVDEYLKFMGLSAKTMEDKSKVELTKVVTHKDNKRVPAVNPPSGGDNMAPGGKGGIKGGFELPDNAYVGMKK